MKGLLLTPRTTCLQVRGAVSPGAPARGKTALALSTPGPQRAGPISVTAAARSAPLSSPPVRAPDTASTLTTSTSVPPARVPAYDIAAAGPGSVALGAGALALVAAGAVAVKKLTKPDPYAGYNLPPGEMGPPVVGESPEYIADMRSYVKRKTEEHGPVWKANLLGSPTVMLGGPEAVAEFMKVEPQICESSLPQSFVTLTTQYMSLNQKGERLRSSRANISQLLGKEAMEAYLPTIEMSVDEFLDQLESKKGADFSLGGELRDWCLELCAQLFMGREANPSLREQMDAFNSGLFGLVPVVCPFTALGKGVAARDDIQTDYKAWLSTLPPGAENDDDKLFALRKMRAAKEEDGTPWTEDRITIAALLMVWGSYVEVATMLGNIMLILPDNPEAARKIRDEAISAEGAFNGGLTRAAVDKKLTYIDAALKETTRYMPPTGPGMRTSEVDLKIAGYDIPAGWVVCADPRIGWCSEEAGLYAAPSKFDPNNFLGVDRAPEDFFPGGVGSHQCPGIPLAFFIAKIFMAKLMQRPALAGGWEPTTDEEPTFEAIPINIIKDEYTIRFTGGVAAAPTPVAA